MSAIYKILVVLCAGFAGSGCFGSSGGNRQGTASVAAASGEEYPVRYTYTVKAVYPHSENSYTQGLYWHDGYLWEGTGQYRQSALMQVDLETGRPLRTVPLDPGYFGEGICLLDGKIYQLTWLEGVALVYDGSTLEQTGTLQYSGQGWGLTTDGEVLYMSNGTHEIHVLEPGTFRKKRSIRVSLSGRRLQYINELEWIDGRIWANIYGTDQIAIINPGSGETEGVVDLTGLLPASERTVHTDVLNGIAYDPQSGKIFVTGKNWPRLYEIEIVKK